MIQVNVFMEPLTRISSLPAITHADGTTSLTVDGYKGGMAWGLSLFGGRDDLRAVAAAINAALDGERPIVAEEL